MRSTLCVTESPYKWKLLTTFVILFSSTFGATAHFLLITTVCYLSSTRRHYIRVYVVYPHYTVYRASNGLLVGNKQPFRALGVNWKI